MKKILISIVGIMSVFVLALAFNVLRQLPQLAQGSVNISHEYTATTTTGGGMNYVVLKTGSGSLGSVVITRAGTATFPIEFFDATTTDVTKRVAKKATTTLASFEGNAAIGTYTFDIEFKDGLLMSVTGGASTTPGTMASTTITWR